MVWSVHPIEVPKSNILSRQVVGQSPGSPNVIRSPSTLLEQAWCALVLSETVATVQLRGLREASWSRNTISTRLSRSQHCISLTVSGVDGGSSYGIMHPYFANRTEKNDRSPFNTNRNSTGESSTNHRAKDCRYHENTRPNPNQQRVTPRMSHIVDNENRATQSAGYS